MGLRSIFSQLPSDVCSVLISLSTRERVTESIPVAAPTSWEMTCVGDTPPPPPPPPPHTHTHTRVTYPECARMYSNKCAAALRADVRASEGARMLIAPLNSVCACVCGCRTCRAAIGLSVALCRMSTSCGKRTLDTCAHANTPTPPPTHTHCDALLIWYLLECQLHVHVQSMLQARLSNHCVHVCAHQSHLCDQVSLFPEVQLRHPCECHCPAGYGHLELGCALRHGTQHLQWQWSMGASVVLQSMYVLAGHMAEPVYKGYHGLVMFVCVCVFFLPV